jgi:uncharacterized protein
MLVPFLADEFPERRYEWAEDGRLIGFVDYYLFGAVAIVTHTEVVPGLEGKGVGSALARRLAASLRDQGVSIVPICEFFASFLHREPEYADCVTPEARRLFGI